MNKKHTTTQKIRHAIRDVRSHLVQKRSHAYAYVGAIMLIVLAVFLRSHGFVFSAVDQPVLVLDPTSRIWPGPYGNETHDVFDYYPVVDPSAGDLSDILSFSGLTAEKKQFPVGGGFPEISSSLAEIKKLFMVHFGSFDSPSPGDLGANTTGSRALGYSVPVQLEQGLGSDYSDILHKNLAEMAQDPYVYEILRTYSAPFNSVSISSGDSGYFSVLTDSLAHPAAYYGAISSPPLRTKIHIRNTTLANLPEHIQGTLFHELLHYFLDKLDYVTDFVYTNFSLFTEHTFIDPVAYRLSLISNIRNYPGAIPLVLHTATNPGIPGFGSNFYNLITPNKQLSGKNPISEKIKSALRDSKITSRAKEGKDLRSGLLGYINGKFYHQFVRQQMQSILDTDTQSVRSAAFYQDTAYMWAYYAALYREALNLALRMLDTPCFTTLDGEERNKYVEKYTRFVVHLSDTLYNDPGVSIDKVSGEIMSKIISEMEQECSACPLSSE